jgi:hypothetical protein
MTYGYLYSPSASYPKPTATLIDRAGNELYTWTNDVEQPPVDSDPPSFLRGWNHVELGLDGCLFAIVPLRALLKLARDGSVMWSARVAAHHDLALTDDGATVCLGERARIVRWVGKPRVLLDNTVVVLDRDGVVVREHSLYDVLIEDSGIRELIRHRWNASAVSDEAMRIVSATVGGDRADRELLRRLRQLPGSPCDVMHANTVEIVADHPAGRWVAGNVLVSLRNLDLIAVVDLDAGEVRWSWGPGVLSGQHQPSVLPDGRVLVFDNGVSRRRSRLVEVDPESNAITWTCEPDSFFTEVAGGCERLPNGNVLATESVSGRAVEVSRAGTVVWRWQHQAPNPAGRASIYRISAVPADVVAQVVPA